MLDSSQGSWSWQREELLWNSLERLRQALAADYPGNERLWASRVDQALTQVETALRQHQVATHASDGLLKEVDVTRPTLARQSDELRSSYDELAKEVTTLRQDVRRAADSFQPASQPSPSGAAGGVVDFGELRRRGESMIAALEANKNAEQKLILESVNTEIGVGD